MRVLITLETFQKVEARLKGGAKAPARADINAEFPLRKFILCGDYNKPLIACWSTSRNRKKHSNCLMIFFSFSDL